MITPNAINQKEYLLFDLDGTITDPKIGITKSVQYALASFGIEAPDLDALEPFIGPPLYQSFMDFYGFDRAKADLAVEKYREYFRETGIFENYLYEGIADLLYALKENGKKLYLATSKPEVFAKQILEHFQISSCFEFAGGSLLNGERVEKADVIRYVMKSCGLNEPHKLLMIGDRKHDIIGAKLAGITSAGVVYGYGSRQELEGAGADFIAEHVADLKALLLNSNASPSK